MRFRQELAPSPAGLCRWIDNTQLGRLRAQCEAEEMLRLDVGLRQRIAPDQERVDFARLGAASYVAAKSRAVVLSSTSDIG